MFAVPSVHAGLSCRHPGQTFEYVERRTWFLDATMPCCSDIIALSISCCC
jgi:hypothetical protein